MRGKYVSFTTEQWRRLGLTYARVERWDPYDRILIDLFGFIDYILLLKGSIVAVQITGSGHAAHKKKILNEPRALTWLEAGGRIQIVSWSKRKVKRGGNAMMWVVRVEEINKEKYYGNHE